MLELIDRLRSSLGNAYTLERELGGGGMSRVFVAEDTRLGRKVVVKVLPPELAADLSVDRFRREIHLAARLQHPHIVPVHSAGEADGLPYYTMPLVEGESLRARMSREGPLPIADASRLLREIADALAYAHSHGVVHRDIKPENVLLASGHALVTDFGVAKAVSTATDTGSVTAAGMALGTPAYMAPEQALAEPALDHRADVYALGAVAYDMLTGQSPFAGLAPVQMLVAHVMRLPQPLTEIRPEIPSAVESLVMRCLAKQPGDRPQSAAEVLATLEEIATADRRGGTSTHQTGSTSSSSLAVLPFVNIGDDQSNDYFAEGMTDELTSALVRVPGLRVISRTMAAAVIDDPRRVNPREIGKRLGTSAVLEGTVRRAGGRLRVTAQLTNVGDGLVSWSETYERADVDVLAVQDDIARSIVERLQSALGSDAHATVPVGATRDALAYELYLKARYVFARRMQFDDAATWLEEALARDPNFARALAALASVCAVHPLYDGSVDPETATRRALDAANRALSLDPTLGEPHAALGLSQMDTGHPVEAERDFRLAIAADPNEPYTHFWYGMLLDLRRNPMAALHEYQRAHTLDTENPIIHVVLAKAMARSHESDVVETELARLSARHPLLWFVHDPLVEFYVRTGRPERAVVNGEAALRGAGSSIELNGGPLGVAGMAYAAAGRLDEAHRILERLSSLDLSPGHSSYAEARIHVGLGDRDAAFAALRNGVVNGRHRVLLWVRTSIVLAALHDDPRWDEFFADLGFGR